MVLLSLRGPVRRAGLSTLPANDPALNLFPTHRTRATIRCRGAQPHPDGPGGAGPPGRLGAVELAPGRLARASAGGADRPRGDERHRRPGDAHARAPSARSLAPDGA